MTPFLADQDFTLYVGDVRDVLAGLPDGSVDCVVTSPPYWGLRDYGTGSWEGGDADCDHAAAANRDDRPRHGLTGGTATVEASTIYRDVCGKCGAVRVDKQRGLESTPDLYVENMVAVFREVRRVLADHGTCWVNLGDSYVANGATSQVPQTKQHVGSGLNGPNRNGSTGLKPKDLVGIPWRTVFALQADGWYLRSDIIWAKPNPMPESVTDRPTKAHEYVFLLSKRPRYWFDAEAVRETATRFEGFYGSEGRFNSSNNGQRNDGGRSQELSGAAGRNVRSVWEIATQPYPEAHFATYPEELVRRCLLAGCPERVCRTCGKPSERIVAKETTPTQRVHNGVYDPSSGFGKSGWLPGQQTVETLGWSDCGHDDYRPGIVLDPFLGSGTTALVARKHGRRCVGVELNPEYAELIARRTRQLSLLAEELSA